VTSVAGDDIGRGLSQGVAPTKRRLCVFGPMRAELDGAAIPITGGDAQRLLGYLALHPRSAHRRETLADVLWPEAPSGSRRALSDTLYRIRRLLGDGWTVTTKDAVGLSNDVQVDVVEFDRLVATGDPGDGERAVALCTGELAPGIYDDWCAPHRTARRSAYIEASTALVAHHEAAGDLSRAVIEARRLVSAEPIDESAQRLYLGLLGRTQRYAEALAHFGEFERVLADEIGVSPRRETRDLIEQLLSERDASAAVANAVSSRFVGRVAERAAALSAVEALFNGTGGVLCVEGVAGIGKSRLLGEIVASARWRRATVLLGEVSEVPESSPLASLERALAPLLDGPMRFHVEDHLDETTLATLGALHSPWRERAGVSTRPADAAATLHGALRTLGSLLPEVGPVVLVLDDVHWASIATWEALVALGDGLTRSGGLLVVAYRRPEIESTAGWPILQAWDRDRRATFIQLEPLDQEAVADLLPVEQASHAAIVHSLTGGIPFYVHEWLHGAGGNQRAHAGELIRRRTIGLPAEARAALTAAAVIGDEFELSIWLEILGIRPIQLAAVCERLETDRWITPAARGYAFTHDLLRSGVYDSVDDDTRRRLHARTATVLAQRDPSSVRTRAYHLDRAGSAMEAVELYRQAAASYVRDSAVPDAVAMWARALELLPEHLVADRLAVALDTAAAFELIGDHARQREPLEEALALAVRIGDDELLLRTKLLEGGAATRTGATERAERTLREAIELAEQLGDRRRHAEARFRWADHLAQVGQWSQAQSEFLISLDLVDAADEWVHAKVLRGLALAAARTGQPADAIGWLEQAFALHEASNDRLSALTTSSSMLTAHFELGNWDAVFSNARQTLALARQLGDPVNVGISSHVLGLASLAVGDHVAALQWSTEAEQCFANADRPRLVALAINARGLIADDAGDTSDAIDCYEHALRMATESGAATEVAYAQHDLGSLRWRLGQVDAARSLLRSAADAWMVQGHPLLQAKSETTLALCLLDAGEPHDAVRPIADAGVELFRSGEFAGEQPQAWLWTLHQLLVRLGDHAAGDVYQAAYDEVLRQASTIADEQQRRGFLELVPLNRTIISASSAHPATTQSVVVRVARADAPLGRMLRPDEYVDVVWTIHCASDEEVSAGAGRRRQRLRRMLDEAAQQQGAPTDADLAAALGVSRRTILRDMKVVSGNGRSSTRRRQRPGPELSSPTRSTSAS
jgi:DNA-binding SARP family transcriptional activator/tetratricopeptide (TPR) repeat protein